MRKAKLQRKRRRIMNRGIRYALDRMEGYVYNLLRLLV